MKRFVKIAAAAALLTSLCGCSDAVAKINNGNEKIITIGKTTITKGELYDILTRNYSATIAVDRASRRIASEYVETTDEIAEKAQGYVDSLKDYYGDQWEEILAESASTEEDFLNTYIESLKVQQLTVEYIDENWDAIMEEKQPVKAVILTFTDANEAAYCTRALNEEVLTLEEAAEEYGAQSSTEAQFFTIDDTSYDTEERAIYNSATPEDPWTYCSNDNSTQYYVIHVETREPKDFVDDVHSHLALDDQIEEDAIHWFFTKYNFTVYDINLYNQLQNSYSYALVQDQTDEPAAETDAE